MSFLYTYNTDGNNHSIMAALGAFRMQRPEDPDPRSGCDLKFDESLPLVNDRKCQDIPVEGHALLPLLTDEDCVQTGDGKHVRISLVPW